MGYTRPDFDIGIIGGGPAGASLASYLAKSGIDCVVLESELFPRPHVGESLVPSSTRVFKEIGFLGKMEENGFVHKFGAVWTSSESSKIYSHGWEGLAPDCRADIRFEEREQPGVEQNYTYHVDRGKFDLLLLQHASELGSAVYEGVTAKNVDFSGDYPEIKFSMGRKQTGIKVRLVVDASGRRTFLGNRLKLKVNDPVFDQYAIHTWFEGFDRDVGDETDKEDYIFVHFLPITNSWIWQIPITDSITSIGIVTQKKNFAKTRESREQFFWDSIATRPEIYENLKRARQPRPLKEEGDYSYAMKQICGDRFLLIGDAARFVDPIFSTGVSIALNSSRFASQDIKKALEKSGFTSKSFQRFETKIRRGMRNWYEFITLYYRLNFLFTAFINDRRYRLDVLKLLQGDVYDDEEPEVLRKMRSIVEAVKRNPNHIWHKLLGDLTADTLRPAF